MIEWKRFSATQRAASSALPTVLRALRSISMQQSSRARVDGAVADKARSLVAWLTPVMRRRRPASRLEQGDGVGDALGAAGQRDDAVGGPGDARLAILEAEDEPGEIGRDDGDDDADRQRQRLRTTHLQPAAHPRASVRRAGSADAIAHLSGLCLSRHHHTLIECMAADRRMRCQARPADGVHSCPRST